MHKCKNCKHYDNKINGKQFIHLGFCKYFNASVRKNFATCCRFEQKRYFEVTRSEQE